MTNFSSMNKEFFRRMHERDQRETPVNEALKRKLSEQLKLGRAPSWFNQFGFWLRSQARPAGGFALAATFVLVVSVVTRYYSVLNEGMIDDWQYGTDAPVEKLSMTPGASLSPQSVSTGLSGAGLASGLGSPFMRAAPSQIAAAPAMPSSMAMNAYESAADASLGFSVGGAKDIGNFRENIKNGFMPIDSDITYEGLFYDYSFDTGQRQVCNELFCPSYARALVRNPVTNQEETYLSVGLNSNIKESDFKRQKTNFVVVLDISGSMSSPFDQYYMDRQGNRIEAPAAEASKTKMQLANEALSALVDQLNPDDRLGIVVFSDEATVAKPLRLVGETNRAALKRNIMKLQPTNGTNMAAGLEAGSKLFPTPPENLMNMLPSSSQAEYANRLIFITDAMPNQGEFGANGLHGLIEVYAARGVQTALLGVGVDFQTELVEALTKVRGANYLSIHSAQEFKKRLGEDFDYLVSPLVYDLKLDVKGSGYAIEEVYGSPDVDLSSGEVLHVRTLFPSKTENGETKGGLVLLKLRKMGEGGTLTLKASYEDKTGKKFNNESTVSFAGLNVGTSDNQGIRKGVLLAQYAKLLKDWIRDERGPNDPFFSTGKNTWERTSRTLQVSGRYKELFKTFERHFKNEANAIGDRDLDREVQILGKLVSVALPVVWPTQPIAPQPMPTDDWRY